MIGLTISIVGRDIGKIFNRQVKFQIKMSKIARINLRIRTMMINWLALSKISYMIKIYLISMMIKMVMMELIRK